jgi:hypothetical protein
MQLAYFVILLPHSLLLLLESTTSREQDLAFSTPIHVHLDRSMRNSADVEREHGLATSALHVSL